MKKCDYCDFYSLPNKSSLQDKYVDALLNEIDLNSNKLKNRTVSTIYFGGGTPSLLKISNINKILDKVYSFDIDNNVEITLECNPETLSFEYLSELKNTKVNRLSIGMQSMDNKILMDIGRIHTKEKFIESYYSARKVGFDNISIDIMFGFLNQSFEDFKNTLEESVALKPEHISCYSLILEDGTKMCDDIKLEDLDEDLTIKMYDHMVCYLKENGYNRYEISNFSKTSYESKHNSSYWRNVEYLGFGASASSYYDKTRYKNMPNLEEYIKTNGDIEKIDVEVNTINDEISEFFFLGLRMDSGVSLSSFEDRFKKSAYDIFSHEIEKLIKLELLKIKEDNLCLTEKGVGLSNFVFEHFLI